MTNSWKKTWTVRSFPEAVARMVRRLPEAFAAACRVGMVARLGPTYAHQRKDFRPSPPRLSLDTECRLVFQHEQIVPFTYTVEIAAQGQETLVEVEAKASGSARDTALAEQVLLIIFALTKALEPPPEE